MADKLSVKDKMAAAKRYIEAKDYGRARAILKTVNHPTAREWEKKLDAQGKPMKRKVSIGQRITRLALFTVFLIIVFLGVGYVMVYLEDQQRYKELLIPSTASLSVYCQLSTNLSDSRCRQWADEIFEDDISLTYDVYICEQISDSVIDRTFEWCINNDGIYLP